MFRSKKLNSKPFLGFPAKTQFTPLPNLLFTTLLPQIDSLVELKVLLHIFWLVYQKKGYPKFVTYGELIRDKTLMGGIEGTTETLHNALESAVKRGVLLHLTWEREGNPQELYFVNTEPNRRAIAKAQKGELSLGSIPSQGEPYIKEEKPDIFTLYEQNIGLLTPMIAEELKEAEKLYPMAWIEDAFREATSLNKRNWRYIAHILERWAAEGKESGEFRRDSKEAASPDRYLKGKYRHLVRR